MTPDLTLSVIAFVLAALVILAGGLTLARAARDIARQTRVGELWIGSVLLAGATSLPEVATSIFAGSLKLPDIAVGNVFGSNIYNLTILALADLVHGRGPLAIQLSEGHVLAGAFGMVLAAMAALAVLIRQPWSIGGIGLDSLAILATYAIATAMLARFARQQAEGGVPTAPGGPVVGTRPRPVPVPARSPAPNPRPAPAPDLSADSRAMGRLAIRFALATLLVLGASLVLGVTADRIAAETGLGRTFVGSILVAASTSLPETVASVAAVRAGAVDLAVGNILGSNLFNMAILAPADLAYRQGPILSAVSPAHAITALFGLLMSGIAVVGLYYRSGRAYLRVGVDALVIVGVYLLATAVLLGR